MAAADAQPAGTGWVPSALRAPARLNHGIICQGQEVLSLQPQSLNWALKHALNNGDTDVFPAPFEYQAIEQDWDVVRSELAAENVLDWNTRPVRSLLAPKAKYSFRSVTQLDPLDFLIFSALVFDVADDLEARRVPIQQSVVFSYRVSTTEQGQLFDREIGYRQFLDGCRKKLKQQSEVTYVATADISDFYSRIYHHRLENALRAATDKTSHVKCIMRLLSGWNGTETFGIPVGCAPSRLLAEATISDVDELMLANGVTFVRFNNDYRIFATSETQAYKHLVLLAEALNRNHGLSLQPQKTSVYDVATFNEQFLSTPLDREISSLHERFEQLVKELCLDGWYDEIDYNNLTKEQQELIDALNLSELFREEMDTDSPDYPVVKFCLRRLGQLGDDGIVDDVFKNLPALIPVFVDLVHYLTNLRFLNSKHRSELGGRLLYLLEDSIVSELPYHRMWILNVFTSSTEWDNEDKFVALFNQETEQPCRRKLILAMGRAQQIHWFQSQWRSLFEHPHWQRRALIAAASCMPGDARRHWYRSIEPQLDLLERTVMKWVRQNPFVA